MKATLIVDGKEFPIEILDKELQNMISGNKKQTGYERVDGNLYYYIGNAGIVEGFKDFNDRIDNDYYKVANYYSSKEVAENNARADKLMRQLRRFAVEHREKDLEWDNEDVNKYFIYYNHFFDRVDYSMEHRHQDLFNIYFDNEECVREAIDTFLDELIWYFTEYKNSL